MVTAALVFLVTGGAYALNTWKIRKIAVGRRLAAIVLEGFQAAAFLLVVVQVAAAPGGAVGLGAYVVGAMLGTAVAMRDRRRAPQEVMAVAMIRPDRACRLVDKPCPWCQGQPEGLERVAVLLSAGREVAYGYRCPWCGSCVLQPAQAGAPLTLTGPASPRRERPRRPARTTNPTRT